LFAAATARSRSLSTSRFPAPTTGLLLALPLGLVLVVVLVPSDPAVSRRIGTLRFAPAPAPTFAAGTRGGTSATGE
jgi:hypothetical protein